MDLSQDVFSSSQSVPNHVGNPVAALHRRETEREVRKRVMGSAREDVLWSTESWNLPKSFANLIQIYSNKTALFPKLNAHAACSIHMVWWNVTERKRRYITTQGQSLVGFLPGGGAELSEGDGEQDVAKSMFCTHELALSSVVPLKEAIAHKDERVRGKSASECRVKQCRLFRDRSKRLRRVTLRLR